MSRILFLICGGFALAAIVCAIQYTLIRLGRFHRNPFIGIATDVTRASEAVWDRAHAAALPWIGVAGILAVAASAIAGAGLLVGGGPEVVDAFSIASGIVGAGAVGVFAIKAEGAARRAARSQDSE